MTIKNVGSNHPSIPEKSVNEAMNLAREYMLISKSLNITENHCCAVMGFCGLKKDLVVISVALWGLMMGPGSVS